VRTRTSQGRLRISHVLEGGAAQTGGAAAEDEIVAINGIRADAESYEELVEHLRVGQRVDLDVFRRDELLRLTLEVAETPADTCYLTLDDAAGEAAVARRRRWLGADAHG
jgi:predicted metalloprotease with PDZ domain